LETSPPTAQLLGYVPSLSSAASSCKLTALRRPQQPLKKALVRHVLQNPALQSSLPEGCPPLKLDSIRFRSIAFASKVFGRKATSTGEAGGEDAGGRSRKRAKEWREAEGSDIRGVRGGFRAREDDDAAGPSRSSNGRVQPLTDAQKRKVALIRGELNDGKKACNAYLVIAALPESVDARAVVRAVVEAANNSVFEGFTIHADHVRPRSAAALLAAAQMAAKPNENLTDVPRNSDGFQVAPADARRTVFIGGLDFAESEENVRAAVEACLVRERGEVPADERYVQNVRVVRDPSSGLGKGFCYVLLQVRPPRGKEASGAMSASSKARLTPRVCSLQDDSCVDELLALPPGKYLKISRRKVRLERCKTAAAAARAKASARTVAGLPPRSATAAGNGSNAPGAAGSRPRPVRLAAPQDPTAAKHHHNPPSKAAHQAELAEALAKLPPSERKAVKSLDAERIARRAQKKEQKRLAERYERKQANLGKKAGGGGAEAILGKESRAAERHRKEKKRIEKQSKSSVKKKK
jgi:nucleolar protein 12